MLKSIKAVEIQKYKEGQCISTPDLVVVEEPLEIRLGYGATQARQQMSIATTMRTPTQHDFELVIGFLFSEGIIREIDDILSIHYCSQAGQQVAENIVRVELQAHILFEKQSLERHFLANSSCGLCGKAHIEIMQEKCLLLPDSRVFVNENLILSLEKIVREKQTIFNHTGGIHAAALFQIEEDVPILKLIREDIGRHNALDKLIGAALQQNLLQPSNSLVFMSSRASFELIQKAIMAQISMLVCVGSPSSLAVEMAKNFNLKLIAFARNGNYNIYS